jgi:formamidopyrimidine-DNA glycosylase
MFFLRFAEKMPEMPEVETIARQLRESIIGKRMVEVKLSGLSLRKPVAKNFSSIVRGRSIISIHRRGKYLLVELAPKAFLLVHLGMSGRILYLQRSSEGIKHVHAVFRFSDSTVLEYRDPRRFGLLAAYEATEIDQLPELLCLGMDPLDRRFTGKRLASCLCKSRKAIKDFLLDQGMIAGLGNIYVCEALFEARIHPMRRCDTVTLEEVSCLAVAIQKVLLTAIKNNGTSFSDFLGADGKRGGNQRFLTVFQKDGIACLRCKTPIQRIRQGNRSSFFCPECQH